MYKYHREHTWVKMDGDAAVIGLTFYAQAHLGEIVYVELPVPGDEVIVDGVLGGIESAKTTSEMIAPISGRIIESNSELEIKPDLINESPLEKGWVTKVRPLKPGQLDDLMDQDAYGAYLEIENLAE